MHRLNSRLLKTAGSALLLTCGLISAGAPRANAEDGCQKRLIHADHQLDRAIDKHGYNSRQADHWRHELREAREWCWEHRHQWWDEHGRRWHSDRDWDDHDHDHN
jgi:hypothetical protein